MLVMSLYFQEMFIFICFDGQFLQWNPYRKDLPTTVEVESVTKVFFSTHFLREKGNGKKGCEMDIFQKEFCLNI